MKRSKKQTIGMVLVLLFLVGFGITPFQITSSPPHLESTPTTSTNFLFNGKTYTFNLDDFYDDENLTKIWTGAKFQTEAFNGTSLEWSGVVNNDTVSPVNNIETQYGDPSNINMINGTTDSADNMKADDSSYTTFNSTHTDGYIHEMPSQWDDFIFTNGTGEVIGELETIDANYSVIDSAGVGGHYPATYSFEGDAIGGNPADFVVDESGGTANIVELIGGHRNVLELHDIDNGKRVIAYQFLSENRTNGIIEWWWRTDDTTDGSYFEMYDDGVRLFIFAFREVSFDYHDGAWHDIKAPALDDTWYHIKILFECGIAGLEGLAQYTWRVFIDQVEYGDYGFDNDQPQVDWILFQTAITHLNYYQYIDAIGYSWDPTYDIGDNRYPYMTLDVQIDIQVDDPDCSSIEYLKYSHKTNVSTTMDLDIWNWSSSTWYEIESIDNIATFDDDSFTLGSSSNYVSGTFQVRIRFQISVGGNDFELQIDRLRLDYLTLPAELEMTITFPFTKYDGLLVMNVSSLQRMNETQTLNFSIWNYDTGSYVLISSSSDTTFTEKTYGTTSPSDFISSAGVVKLHWIGTNITNDFQLHIDYLFVQIYYKLDLVHLKSFDTNGIYRYRWCVMGSIHYTQWVNFEVIDPVANFHAISESDLTTRWILQGSDISPVENFSDALDSGSWFLLTSDGDKMIEIDEILEEDSYVHSGFPTNNYGSTNEVFVFYDNILVEQANSLIEYVYPYLDANYTSNSTLYYYGTSNTDGVVNVYHTTDFDEGTVTWNTQPATGDFQMVWNGALGWNEEGLGAPNEYYKFISPTDMSRTFGFYSKDNAIRNPRIRHHLSKYYVGGGLIYMQTDELETISLRSDDYGTHYNLSSGDYFELDFQTSSDSQINLILLKDGDINKTLTLSQSGNTNFNRHTVQISVDEFVEFDQLKISSTFEDADYVKVYDIKTYKYTITGDTADFYVSSRNQRDIYLNPDTYNLRIFEGGTKKIDENITIDSTDYYYTYDPTNTIQCRITLFSDDGEYLQFEDYHIQVNRSLNEEYNEFWLSDALFHADIDTYVYIKVYDRFDASINNFTRLASSYIDLELEVYSLKIRNEATEIVVYTLSNNDTGSSKSGILFSDEIVGYHIKTGNYSLDYTNCEDMYPRKYNFELTGHKTISINTTYHTVYFGLFTYDGLGLNRDWVRFYINDVRKDFGLNIIQSETAHLIVLDYFNNTLANETIDASAWSEWNIYVQVYSLYILNRFTYCDLVINITQVGSGTWMNQLIPSSSALLYRFIPNINYTINATYVDGTVYSIRTINLTDNSQTESFGVPTQPEEYPKNVFFGVYTTMGLGIDHNLLKFYIDGDRADFGFNTIEDMIIQLTVKDYFNTILFNQYINTSGIYEYDILITLYSLKVKNEARVLTNYTLSFGALEMTGFIIPEEIIEYQLATNNYVFDYTNNEDGSFHTININLNQDRVYILNSTYYNIYFNLYDVNLHIFNPYQYEFRLNNTIQDLGLIEDLQSNDYDITVKDRFGTYLFNSIITLRGLNEYRIDISLYELQIRHLAYENSNLTLAEVVLGNNYSFIMTPDSIKSIVMGSSNYTLNWTNGENNQLTSFSINLTSDSVIKLNTTYFDVHFGLFTYDGMGVNHDFVRFYINNERKDFGKNTLKQDTNTLKILDYFGQTLYSESKNLRSYTEWNIYVTIYTLNLFNNYSFPIDVKIERNDIEVRCAIPPQSFFQYRFIPLVEYEITWYYENGTKIDSIEIEFEENGQIVSFGFFEEEVPYDPEKLVITTTVIIAFIMVISIGCIIIAIMWAYMKKEKDEIPKDVRLREKRKKRIPAGTFDHRI